jgi:hypothetical protein
MPADGLTKILPRQKHEEFVKHLHLTDISGKVTDQQALDHSASA